MKRVVSVVAAVASWGCGLIFLPGDTPPDEVHRLVDAGARLIDVRSPGEFEGGHLPGAINIPVGQLAEHLPAVESKDTPVIVYCRSGHRSSRAAQTLRDAGFTAVHDMGAMRNW